MLLKTELHWSYTPGDFVEPDTPPIKTGLGEWTFNAGKATCALDTPVQPVSPRTLQDTREELFRLFTIRGMQEHRLFDVQLSPTIHQHTEAGISVTITGIAGLISSFSTGRINAIVQDAAGNVVSDSGKRRRELDSHSMAELNAKAARSETLTFMIESYVKAMRQPESQFVRLFEIIDALDKHFGGEARAKDALKAAAAARTALGTLANATPVYEGRHNGCHIDQLRPATPEEKARACQAAKDLIQIFAVTL